MSTPTPPEQAEEGAKGAAGPEELPGEPLQPPVNGTMAPPEVPSQETRLWLEVGAVLALAWVPDFYYAVASLSWGSDTSRPSVSALCLLVRWLWVSGPVLYILWRSAEGWARFG